MKESYHINLIRLVLAIIGLMFILWSTMLIIKSDLFFTRVLFKILHCILSFFSFLIGVLLFGSAIAG